MCEYVLPDSEVEVLVINHADVMMMQNWAHVQTVLNACNGLPKDAHGGNIMRVHKGTPQQLGASPAADGGAVRKGKYKSTPLGTFIR